ncbi:putative 2,4-dienoyl-CoA reductase decr-1.2 [Dirofilaria immitis]
MKQQRISGKLLRILLLGSNMYRLLIKQTLSNGFLPELLYQKYIEAATSAALSLITNLGFGHPGILRGAVSEFAIQYTSHDVITDYSQYCIR